MGPHTDQSLLWLRNFRADHPEVLITYPTETMSGLWEVSLPDSACLAFDSVTVMRRALCEVYPDGEHV
jgi:hypothetical protein